MAAIARLVNHKTKWDASQLNQYANLFSNVLGVTDTAQDPLGKLVLPRGTAFPSSVVKGQVFFRTDLGTNGRFYIYNGTSWTPYLPLRQALFDTCAGDTITAGVFTDTTLSLSITTTGGQLLIILAGGLTSGNIRVSGNGVSSLGYLRAVVGAVNLGQIEFGTGATNNIFWMPAGAFMWHYAPPAGTYTVKIQALQANTGALASVILSSDVNLMVLELS